MTSSRGRLTDMVARTKPYNDELIVDFTDSRGMIIHRERVGDGVQAAAVITAAIARRKELRAGDLIRVVVPPADDGAKVLREPREID
jgi:hypothetical protein